MAEVSEWKRPSDVMKIHRRRKSVSQKRIASTENDRTTVIYKSPSKPVKRRNPFSVSEVVENPAKRQHIENDPNSKTKTCALFEVLSNSQKEIDTQQLVSGVRSDYNQKVHQINKLNDAKKQQEKGRPKPVSDTKNTGTDTVLPYVPVDWSLKTKMRIVSNKSLQWCTQLKSTDEAHGVTDFVCASKQKVNSENEQKQSFQSCCMYWEHPNIPWARLFPRIIDDSKLGGSGSFLMQDEIQKTLQADWEQSFTSVFHQLRSRLCPYFYLCTHQFTVVFCNQSEMVAMVTPTTRGFREALNTEGISFKLPVGNENKPKSPDRTRSECKENDQAEDTTENKESNSARPDDAEGDEILDTDDAAAGWLESIGLDKKAFPSLDPRKVKIQREGFRVIDNRPESLVLVQGSDVQALFNFLLNCRTCTATSGPQAGIPPTILSPKPFKGATLKSHKVKHSMIKQNDKEGHISHAHILEVTGPVLPSHSQALTTLLHQTQAADFSIVYNNHDATTPFNILPRALNQHKDKHTICGKKDNSASQNERDTACVKGDNLVDSKGDHSPSVKGDNSHESEHNEEGFYKNVEISDRLSAIKEIICKPGGFTWNS